jgi:flagellar hook-associated protein 1 FlgK
MSLQSLLSIARSALLTHQRAMAVTAHNVANAETPGYSRQRLNVAAMDPLWGPFGPVGRGVTDLGVSRAREQFFDASFRRDSGLLGGSSTLRSFLSQIEGFMNEPSDQGVAAALDDMFSAFSDLANDPSSSAVRDIVRTAAERFVHVFHRLDGDLTETQVNATAKLSAEVDEINVLAERIADLNTRILAQGGVSHSAPDLEDQRDVLVDQLSSKVGVRVTKQDDGTYLVAAGNIVIVDRGTSQALELRTPPGNPAVIGLAGGGPAIDTGAGSASALLDLLNVKIPGLRTQLDGMAASMVAEFNAIHRLGYTASGITGTDFFDPAGVTAGSIRLTAAISGSSANIAAGATPAAGDGNIALELARLGERGLASLGGRTLRDYYTGIAGSVGTQSRAAAQDEDTYDTLVANDDMRRASVSGVSAEEEMVLLIGQQQAYQAAARIIRIADEMMQDVMSIL